MYKVTESSITIAVEDFSDDFNDETLTFNIFMYCNLYLNSLCRLANDVTFKRLREAMQDLKSYHEGPAKTLRDVLFGWLPPAFSKGAPQPLKVCTVWLFSPIDL